MDTALLLVDPDDAFAVTLAAQLGAAGYAVERVADVAAARSQLARARFACLLVELELRPGSGLDLVRALRADPRTAELPAIVLSSRDAEIDRVVAFEVGADDYVVKPCSVRELALRVRARIRRVAAPVAVAATLREGPLEIDLQRRRASLAGRPLALTSTELALLVALARRAGDVVSRQSLLSEVWSLPSHQNSRTLDTHLRRLREKLGGFGEQVQTLRGVGYRLDPVSETPVRHTGAAGRPESVTDTSRG